MSVIGSNILAGASGQGGGYNLTKSLRFRSSASAYLNRTLGSSGSLRAWTWSAWVKRGTLGVQQDLFGWVDLSGGNFQQVIGFNSDNTLEFQMYNSALGGYVNRKTTTQVFRDPSAWYHIVVTWDSNNATANDRARIYINGTRVTAWANNTNPSLNQDSYINNSSYPLGIGRCMPSSSNYFDGYLAEINFVNAQALDATSFGETSTTTGVWIPKKYTGTYGTNGFYLPFTDVATTSGSNAGLGKDFSGNGNYWTTNNISVTSGSTYDSMKDVPTLTDTDTANYAVMNPLNSASSMTPSGGNLNVVTSSVSVSSVSTISVNSGKWYCEITIANVQDSTIVGIAPSDRSYISGAFYSVTGGVAYYQDGTKFISGVQTSYGASYTTNDVIGIALDMDAGTVTFYKNNTSQGTAASGLIGGYYFAVADASSGSNTSYNVNFGQQPFAYTPPTGFVALNTYNLPTPTIGATASTTANKYFDVKTWSGNSSTQSIPLEFAPDLIWNKSRSAASGHSWWDVIRGAGAQISSNETNAETTGYNAITSFSSNAISLGADNTGTYNGRTNETGRTYVGWAWKANGTGVTNTAGSITSTVSANTTAGFSIVTYTGTGSNATVGHGLGVAPAMYIVKQRSSPVASWRVYHQAIGNTGAVYLNTTVATETNSIFWNNTSPTSTTFSLGTDGGVNGSTNTYVAYCFAPIAGYSAFGSYTGNGSTDGPFVFTGFRPRFIMIKRSDSSDDWIMMDSSRSTYNVAILTLYANGSFAEDSNVTNRAEDFLSNGFKIRSSPSYLNASGGTYIYMAFAESPFKYSLGR